MATSFNLEQELALLEPLRTRAARSGALRIAIVVAIALATLFIAFVAAFAGVLLTAWLDGRPAVAFILFFAAPALVVLVGAIAAWRIYKAIGRAPTDEYTSAFATRIVAPLVTELVPFGTVRAGEAVDREVFVRSRLFDAPTTYQGTVRVDGDVAGHTCTAGAVDAVMHVHHGGSGGEGRPRIFAGLFAWLALPVRAPTPVLVVTPEYFSEPRKYRRRDLVRGGSGDAAFDREFIVCVDDTERTVPELPDGYRRTLQDLHHQAATPLYAAFGPDGIALAASTDNRLPLEGRLVAASQAQDLARDAQVLATLLNGLRRLSTLPPLTRD